MKKIDNHQPSNFWFGFALGGVTAFGTSYLLGTKKGREFLKEIVELSEQFPERIPEFIEDLKKFSFESTENKPSGIKTIESIISKIKHRSDEK